ncbi:MAG: serine/threonine protein kinase, partial [Woeseiaceae bacterium]
MSANSDNLEHSYSQQLSDFAEQLKQQTADETLLDNIHAAIQALLSENGDIEADIRRILGEQHKAGNLRDETFELVQRMLDRMMSEDLATAPIELAFSDEKEDPFGDTTVIETLTPDEESADDRLQVGSVLRDRFLLQERIAGGSMGVVYKALDRRLAEADGVDPSVAIKVLTPKLARNGHALRALQQEAAKGRCLMHPNIVRFIDLDREDELYFIVMEWLDGKSLASILDDSSSKKIDKDTALDIVR